MGKSGLVGAKISATLSSLGQPSHFVHPAEAAHGDLGMLTAHDVVLALSNSGKTGEIVALLPGLKKLGVKLIAMTGNVTSSLARLADDLADLPVQRFLVGFHRQEEVGPLLLELPKNGCWVCRASAWISTPSRSRSPSSFWSTARSWFSPVA